MNVSQLRSWDEYAERYVVAVAQGDRETSIAEHAELVPEVVFGRRAPLIVEIGSGDGESLVPMAAARPEADILAFEVFQPAVATTVGKLARAGVDNVRVVMADGADGLRHLVPLATLTELWLFFPDPWHKTRHHKRRLVSPAFADLVASRLAPGGLWRLATDWDDYALAMRAVLDEHPELCNVHAAEGGWAPRLDARPVTKYERRGLVAGRVIRDLTYRRRP